MSEQKTSAWNLERMRIIIIKKNTPNETKRKYRKRKALTENLMRTREHTTLVLLTLSLSLALVGPVVVQTENQPAHVVICLERRNDGTKKKAKYVLCFEKNKAATRRYRRKGTEKRKKENKRS